MPATLRRPLAVAGVLFVLIFAFLAGRVHAGADPAQATAPAAQRSATPAPSDPYGAGPYGDLGSDDGVEPDDGDEPDDGVVPGQGVPPVPGQGTVPSPGGQDLNPPTTQAS